MYLKLQFSYQPGDIINYCLDDDLGVRMSRIRLIRKRTLPGSTLFCEYLYEIVPDTTPIRFMASGI